MPALSDSMEQGTILKWLVESGVEVSRGQEIVEIETDKATMTCEADEDGRLTIVAAEGEARAVGAPIATIGAPDPSALPIGGATVVADGVPMTDQLPDAGSGRSQERHGETSRYGRIISPVAQRLALKHEVDISQLTATGRGGRIVKADVIAMIRGRPPVAQFTASPAGSPMPSEQLAGGKGRTTIAPLSRLQQVVAQRMAESRATVPDFTLAASIDMEQAVELRSELKSFSSGLQTSAAPSFNDFIVKACAIALREFPRVNGAYKDGTAELYERVNVGVAVAAEHGLVVPVVADADQRSLGDIAATTRALGARVRSSEIVPSELSGGTFTVSNLGMFNIAEFTALINPPQAAILAVGAIEQRPVVRAGVMVPRHMMNVTLSCDHRILDGATAAPFLGRVKELLESPLSLLL